MENKKPEFTEEQLCYLHELLAIEPCHISGEHSPNHHLDGKICNHQRSDAWTRIMKGLGFDPERPERKLHDNCGWCHERKGKELHQAWALDVLLLPSYFEDANKIPHREVWWLAELPGLENNFVGLANLKQFLRAKKFPAPEDCNQETCPKKNKGWCPDRKCMIAREL